MILIDYKDRRPIYEQIVEKFQQMIICGVMEPDSPMPSVRSLAMELSINPIQFNVHIRNWRGKDISIP